MFPKPPLLASLSDRWDRALRRATGRPPRPPGFDGLLDELFARWPLEAGECPGRERRRDEGEAA